MLTKKYPLNECFSRQRYQTHPYGSSILVTDQLDQHYKMVIMKWTVIQYERMIDEGLSSMLVFFKPEEEVMAKCLTKGLWLYCCDALG